MTTEEQLEAVKSVMLEQPSSSVRSAATATGISRSSCHRAIRELSLSPFHPQRVVELTEEGCELRCQFSEIMLQQLTETPNLVDKIL